MLNKLHLIPPVFLFSWLLITLTSTKLGMSSCLAEPGGSERYDSVLFSGDLRHVLLRPQCLPPCQSLPRAAGVGDAANCRGQPGQCGQQDLHREGLGSGAGRWQ